MQKDLEQDPDSITLRRHNITLQQADAVDCLAAWGVSGTEAAFDLVFLDAFDGDDNVPPQLCTPGVNLLSTFFVEECSETNFS